MKSFYDEIKESIDALERELGLPAGFFIELRKDSDWSFIIKLHALIEAALVQGLEHELGRPEINEFLGRLNINGRIGKLALGRALGLVESDLSVFIERLSDIRNKCVHDVRNVGFSLKDYIAGLDKDKKRVLDRALDSFVVEEMEIEGKKIPRLTLLEQQPLFTLWIAAMVCLAVLWLSKERARLVRERVKLALSQAAGQGMIPGFGLVGRADSPLLQSDEGKKNDKAQ
jgi:hypothetical protein